ncbi:MAG: ABC-2 family transporter protein [Planctomycetota bacterium]
MSGALSRTLGTARRMLAIQRQYVRIGWIRKSQFRVEFINQVLMDCVFYVSFILTFEFLFELGGSGDAALDLGGWTRPEMRLYLGFAFVSDAVLMTLLGQQWHFGADLKDGKLDAFRTKPGPTAYLYFFQRFSPEGLTNLIIASGWLTYALVGLEPGSVAHGWLLPLALLHTAFVQIFLVIGLACFELFVLHSGIGHLVSHIAGSLGERPLEVYPSALSRFLLFVLPVGATAWYPSSLLLGKLDLPFAAVYPLATVTFAWVAATVFRRGLRRYDSAMG